VSPTSFFQTNVKAAGLMVELVQSALCGAGSVLDLYAGAGLFTLPLAKRGSRVTAVEESAVSVADGEASRRVNHIAEAQCRFVRARAEDVATGRHRRALSISRDAVVMDPPRQGCAPAVLTWVAHSLRPATIAYVSCNPEALATDAGVLVTSGYRLVRAQPVDMFPHTPHIETVAVFER
jgi:23S rRNA (uracil1939-C5)-methyltransferase